MEGGEPGGGERARQGVTGKGLHAGTIHQPQGRVQLDTGVFSEGGWEETEADAPVVLMAAARGRH